MADLFKNANNQPVILTIIQRLLDQRSTSEPEESSRIYHLLGYLCRQNEAIFDHLMNDADLDLISKQKIALTSFGYPITEIPEFLSKSDSSEYKAIFVNRLDLPLHILSRWQLDQIINQKLPVERGLTKSTDNQTKLLVIALFDLGYFTADQATHKQPNPRQLQIVQGFLNYFKHKIGGVLKPEIIEATAKLIINLTDTNFNLIKDSLMSLARTGTRTGFCARLLEDEKLKEKFGGEILTQIIDHLAAQEALTITAIDVALQPILIKITDVEMIFNRLTDKITNETDPDKIQKLLRIAYFIISDQNLPDQQKTTFISDVINALSAKNLLAEELWNL